MHWCGDEVPRWGSVRHGIVSVADRCEQPLSSYLLFEVASREERSEIVRLKVGKLFHHAVSSDHANEKDMS